MAVSKVNKSVMVLLIMIMLVVVQARDITRSSETFEPNSPFSSGVICRAKCFASCDPLGTKIPAYLSCVRNCTSHCQVR